MNDNPLPPNFSPPLLLLLPLLFPTPPPPRMVARGEVDADSNF